MERAKLNRVNAAFTMLSYLGQMVDRVQVGMKLCVYAMAVLLGIGVVATGDARAQNSDIDWADAGVASQGTVPNGTTVTGSDGTTATVSRTVTTSGGSTFTAATFATDFLSYFNGQIGDGQSPLLLNFDNSEFDPLDKVTYEIVLSQSVTNLNFALSDVDNGTNTDAIEVFYDDDLTGGFTNAANDTSLWSIGPSVTRTNDSIVNGWRGTAPSNQFTTDGDVAFDFNGTAVRRIRVVYFSYSGTGNPSGQFVGLSDLAYSAQGVDLSLTKVLIGAPPVQGGSATWRLTVVNDTEATETATSIVVRDTFPSGFTFGTATGDGSFNTGNSNWSVPDLAPGESAILTITGTISSSAGTTITNTAEIIAANENDIDSTVNNGNNGEDDFATSTFTVQTGRSPGIPPILSCPAGSSLFDWDTISGWTSGTTDNTYAFASLGDVRFELDNDGVYLNNALFGGQSPNAEDVFSGGLPTAEASLNMLANQADQNGEVEITITLPQSLTGVQFTIFDVDFLAGQFADRIEVTGSNGASSSPVTLTNGNVNFISGGNVAIGDGASENNQALGNVVVTFTGAVDTIVIRYGNHTTAPGDPGQQIIGIHDLLACNPVTTTTLSVSKISSIIADPVNGNTNPKAIPGATIEYLITVANTGLIATDPGTVVVWDDGPADAKMCLIGRSGGPVIFGDPGSNSNLTYDYGGAGSVETDLAVTTDDLEFSDDGGVTFDYTPIDDGEGCDTLITDFRVNPAGAFSAGGDFTITVRYEVE